MKPLRWIAAVLLALVVEPALAEDKKPGDTKDDGFVPMFDGKTLKGWVNVNCYPGTFFVKDEMIITTGKPTGFLRTQKQYENFIAEFDWMHIPPAPGEVGNSGFFVWADPIPATGTGYTRGIEVQVLVNLTYKNKKGEITATSQGDLFSIWGATCVPDRPHPDGWARCLPSENRAKGENEWNHYRVEANDGVLKLVVNGKVVSGVSKCSPRKGYLALESEGSECRFRNLKIKELPTTNPTSEETADVSADFKNLLTGLDLPGWKADAESKKEWQARDWMVHFTGKTEGKETALRSEKTFGDCEFIADVRFPAKKEAGCAFIIRAEKDDAVQLSLTPFGELKATAPGWVGTPPEVKGFKPNGMWNRLSVTLEGKMLTVKVNGSLVVQEKLSKLPAKGTLGLRPEGEMDFGNLFIRELK